MSRIGELIWLTTEKVYGNLVSYGAFVSRVCYTVGGMKYDVFVENDEFVFLETRGDDHGLLDM